MSVSWTHKTPLVFPQIVDYIHGIKLSPYFAQTMYNGPGSHVCFRSIIWAKFHRSKCRNPWLAKSHKNFRQGIFAIVFGTQGNYATQDNSGLYHLMPQWHLPEWREEDELAFVHCGDSGLNYAMTSNRVCHKAFEGVVRHFVVTLCKCS